MAPGQNVMSYRVTQEVENISNRCLGGFTGSVCWLLCFSPSMKHSICHPVHTDIDISFLNMHKAVGRIKDQASYIQTGIGASHDCLSPLPPSLSFYTIHHSHWYPLYLLTYRLIPSLFHHPSLVATSDVKRSKFSWVLCTDPKASPWARSGQSW